MTNTTTIPAATIALPTEEVISVRKITGKDGQTRELVIVKKLGTNTSEYGVANPNRSTFRSYPAGPRGRRSTLPRGLANALKHGYGHKLGFVTDGVTYRYA
jgi:hypothetical protein